MPRIRLTWVFAVSGLITSRPAISALREALGDQADDLALALGQRGELGRWLRGSRRAANSAISRRVTVGASSASPAATSRMACRRSAGASILEQEAARPRAQRTVDVLVEVERREHEHAVAPASWVVGTDQMRGLETVEHRHADVHQDDVREDPAREIDGLAPVGCLGDDLQLVLGVDQRGEPAAYRGLVVGDEDADHRAAAAVAVRRPGSRSSTGRRPASRRPAPRARASP